MKRICVCLAALALLVGSLSIEAAPFQSPRHDLQFWREIARNHFAVPPGLSASALAREASANLASVNPERRDDLSYSILYVWVVRQDLLVADDLNFLLDEWQANLRIGLGKSGSEKPFLGEVRYRRLFELGLAYLNEERDLRGFDPVKGWIHSTAHTADLLAALARNPYFSANDQQRLLESVARRLSSAGQVYSYGEQDRLAVAVVAGIARADFNTADFYDWLNHLNETDLKVWNDSPPDDARLKAFQNDTYFLEALAARLSAEPKSPATGTVLTRLAPILSKR